MHAQKVATKLLLMSQCKEVSADA